MNPDIRISMRIAQHLQKCTDHGEARFIKSKALETDSVSLQPTGRGHCYTPKGDGELVPVFKCTACGYSIRR